MENKLDNYKKEFLKMYEKSDDPEINEMVAYIKKYDRYDMISNELSRDYSNYQVVCMTDEDGDKYVLHNGRRVYFPNKYNDEEIQWRFIALVKEQDYYSPHKYLNDRSLAFIRKAKAQGLKIIIFELGAMEGMFSLELQDLADEIYLFEPDEDWYGALKKTFKSDKVKIINRMVDNFIDEETITIDSMNVNVNNALVVLKMDIEGKEVKALESMRRTINSSKNFMGFICAYHKEYDEMQIKKFFEGNEFFVEHNTGYFLFYVDEEYKEPYIRRCILRVYKEEVGE